MIKAVITGDIIHSTEMSAGEKEWLFKSLKLRLKGLDKDYNSKSELYRGDSFQCLVDNPKDALRVALIIKTFIRCLNPNEIVDVTTRDKPETAKSMVSPVWIFDARMAIGIGEVDLEMKHVATSNGVAFQLSGEQLDHLKNTRMRLAIAAMDEYFDELATESVLLDAIITKTSALQCEVISLKLLGYTEMAIAKRLKIRQSAVNQRSIAGNWNAINAMVERFEKIYGDE
ncbi:MAG: hypothetical protein ACKVOK_13545 [Flavobacteriales bacterium]